MQQEGNSASILTIKVDHVVTLCQVFSDKVSTEKVNLEESVKGEKCLSCLLRTIVTN